jgi:hypothetical protein
MVFVIPPEFSFESCDFDRAIASQVNKDAFSWLGSIMRETSIQLKLRVIHHLCAIAIENAEGCNPIATIPNPLDLSTISGRVLHQAKCFFVLEDLSHFSLIF